MKAAIKVGELKVMNAFKNSTFVYGTQGKGSSTVLAAKAWAAHALSPSEQGVARQLNLFEPGVRVGTYLSGDIQMMDMYYGQKDNDLYLKRDPSIAEFIHYVMDYKGPFSIKLSGRDAFLSSTDGNFEGWDSRGPKKYNGNTATVEISRAIRWGIQRFGGKLIFEGKQVYYSQVFNTGGYRGDTDREAIGLFEYFRPGISKATFGKGTVTFYWNGHELVPTHCHFLSNWGFPKHQTDPTRVSDEQAAAVLASRQAAPAFYEFASKKPSDIGALQHHALNHGSLDSWLKEKNVALNKPLWDRFQDKPTGLEGIPTDTILRLFEKGLSLGYI
ncbi:MAG: hypothetical protein ABSG03_10225 [Bryobacteraceae bacterium]